jgi:hypothetical protein
MSWQAVDDRFVSHRKRMAMIGHRHHATALALWVLALSWCGSQDL